MDEILCRKCTQNENKRQQNEAKFSIFSDWDNYTVLKASFCGSGKHIYKDWYELSADEIWMHVGLHAVYGLSPSPRTETKFERHSIDSVNGNDLVNESFGGVPSKLAKQSVMFKSFFRFQYPRLLIPYKKTHPNFNIDPFFNHLLVSFKSLWYIGEKISFDEGTRGYKKNISSSLS